MRTRFQRRWYPRGWCLMLTVGQVIGLGIMWHGRFNGVSFHLGPVTLDIQPPAPEWMKGEIKPASNDDAISTAS